MHARDLCGREREREREREMPRAYTFNVRSLLSAGTKFISCAIVIIFLSLLLSEMTFFLALVVVGRIASRRIESVVCIELKYPDDLKYTRIYTSQVPDQIISQKLLRR